MKVKVKHTDKDGNVIKDELIEVKEVKDGERSNKSRNAKPKTKPSKPE